MAEIQDLMSLQADTLPTGSISFGRFELESLSWERRSVFSHNRYLEEVEKYSKPGSVTQKKAYFEAHFKKKALERLASTPNNNGDDCQTAENGIQDHENYIEYVDQDNGGHHKSGKDGNTSDFPNEQEHDVMESIGGKLHFSWYDDTPPATSDEDYDAIESNEGQIQFVQYDEALVVPDNHQHDVIDCDQETDNPSSGNPADSMLCRNTKALNYNTELVEDTPLAAARPIMASLSNHQTAPSSDVPYELRSPLSGVRKNLPVSVDAGLKDRSPSNPKISTGDAGYILEDVPHLTDYISDLPTYPNPLQDNPAYSVVKQYFVNTDDSVAQKIVVHKDSPRGVHFRRAGPRQKVYFESDEVNACIVTCGGLCPGLNTIIREIVCGLSHMYGVTSILGIEWGYMGFYARNTIPLTPKSVNDIHKRGGTVLGTSRGGHDTSKIVDSIEDRGINQVYIIGGDGSQKGASVIFEEIQRRGLKVAVAGIPKTIDNDIPVIDKSFGFDSAVEEAQRAISAAHVEAGSVENGIGVVKLMGRYSGFIAMYATLASRDVDCCLIPESPFYLEGKGGLFEYIEKRLKENGHMVIVAAEGAGQELIAESMRSRDDADASGNKQLLDVGYWLSHKIKNYFAGKPMMPITLKYIDPTYMIRAIPSNASDNVYCTLLAHSAIHGAMAGYTGFTVGQINGRHAYIPFHRITEKQNMVVITDRMWARLLCSTNQPSFPSPKEAEDSRNEEPVNQSFFPSPKEAEDSRNEEPVNQSFF